MLRKTNQKTCPELAEGFVIGVDGGGTKTVVALADLSGKILKTVKAGPSSPRNIGVGAAADNIAGAIREILNKKEIASTCIGLASVAEQPHFKREIIKELKKHREISKIFKGKVFVESDQLVAFKSGTDKKDGIILIAGTGCVSRGWKGGKEAKASGWGWLEDKGSAFWAGQLTFQKIMADLDGRGRKTLMTKKAFEEFKIKKVEDLISIVYSENQTRVVPKFAIICDMAARRGDKVAKEIMADSGIELAITANAVIKKLNFQKALPRRVRLGRKKFPLVLAGAMFKSNILLNTVKKEIRKIAPKTEFIRPKADPVVGAVKLALETMGKNHI